jgi:hypothetical protein
MRQAAIRNKDIPDCVKLLPQAALVDGAVLPPPEAAEGGGEGYIVPEELESLLLVPVPVEAVDDVVLEYRALATPLLEGAGHTVGNCMLHADCVQSADAEAYSEPTVVGVQ